jgi:hypothetical protein
VAMVRRPSATGVDREQVVRQYRTFTAPLRELRAWLVAERVGWRQRPSREIRSSRGRRYLLLWEKCW